MLTGWQLAREQLIFTRKVVSAMSLVATVVWASNVLLTQVAFYHKTSFILFLQYQKMTLCWFLLGKVFQTIRHLIRKQRLSPFKKKPKTVQNCLGCVAQNKSGRKGAVQKVKPISWPSEGYVITISVRISKSETILGTRNLSKAKRFKNWPDRNSLHYTFKIFTQPNAIML